MKYKQDNETLEILKKVRRNLKATPWALFDQRWTNFGHEWYYNSPLYNDDLPVNLSYAQATIRGLELDESDINSIDKLLKGVLTPVKVAIERMDSWNLKAYDKRYISNRKRLLSTVEKKIKKLQRNT
jgi:hypothetical protein